MLSSLYDKVTAIEPEQLRPWMISITLLLLTYTCATQLWASYQSYSHKPTYQANNAPVKQSGPANYNARSITNNNLFGSGASDTNGSMVLPATQLNLILRGAFTSSNPKQASAIIQGPDGETRSFKTNSLVYNNARLKSVFSDRIILSRDGDLETLYFPAPGSEAAKPSSNNNSKTSSSTDLSSFNIPDNIVSMVKENMSPEEIQQASKQLQSKSMSPEQRQDLIRKRLQDLRDRARKNKGK